MPAFDPLQAQRVRSSTIRDIENRHTAAIIVELIPRQKNAHGGIAIQ
jgi:hypothetical protein